MHTHDLLDYEIRRTHAGPSASATRDARARAEVRAERRRTRRHRLADRVRSVADRLEA